MKILVVEDDEVLSDGIARSLRLAGNSVELARDGVAAIEALALYEIELLILDYQLPGVHGVEVLRQARARRPRLPVLLISAYDDAEARVGRAGLSVDGFLAKPFSLDALDASIRRLQDRREGLASDATSLNGVDRHAGCEVGVPNSASKMAPHLQALLQMLIQRNGGLVDNQEIAERLSEWPQETGPNAVSACVGTLRAQLRSCEGMEIVAVRGLGWRLVNSRETLPIG